MHSYNTHKGMRDHLYVLYCTNKMQSGTTSTPLIDNLPPALAPQLPGPWYLHRLCIHLLASAHLTITTLVNLAKYGTLTPVSSASLGTGILMKCSDIFIFRPNPSCAILQASCSRVVTTLSFQPGCPGYGHP